MLMIANFVFNHNLEAFTNCFNLFGRFVFKTKIVGLTKRKIIKKCKEKYKYFTDFFCKKKNDNKKNNKLHLSKK